MMKVLLKDEMMLYNGGGKVLYLSDYTSIGSGPPVSPPPPGPDFGKAVIVFVGSVISAIGESVGNEIYEKKEQIIDAITSPTILVP